MLALGLQVDLTRIPRRDDAMETLLGEVMARAAGDVLQYNVPKTMDACEVVAELMRTHGTPYLICIDEVQVNLLSMRSCSNAKFGPLNFIIVSQDAVSKGVPVSSVAARLGRCLSGMSKAVLHTS